MHLLKILVMIICLLVGVGMLLFVWRRVPRSSKMRTFYSLVPLFLTGFAVYALILLLLP